MNTQIVEICRVGIPTKSGKIFSREVLEAQISRLQETIERRSLMGVLGVPEDTLIYFKDASHLVTRLFMDGDKLMAEIEIIDTPAGQVLKKLLDQKVKVGFHMAGVGNGSVEKKDGKVALTVNDNYRLIQIYASND